MKNYSISACAVALLALFSGCKKAEQPALIESHTNQVTTAPRTSPPPAGRKQPNNANETVVLKAKWPVGNRYVYRLDVNQRLTNHIPQLPTPMRQDVSIAMTYAISVQKQIDDGRELEMEFLANEMEVKMGNQVFISFDSKESSDTDAQNPVTKPIRKMIGSKVHLQVDDKGHVTKVLDLEEWQERLTEDSPGAGSGMVRNQFNEGFFRQILELGRGLPDKPVQVGDTWPMQLEIPTGPAGKVTADMTVTFTGWENRQQRKCAALNTTGTFKGTVGGGDGGPMGQATIEDGKAWGRSWFDPDLGTVIETDVDQSMRIKGRVPGGTPNRPASDFTVESGQKITINLVELGKAKE